MNVEHMYRVAVDVYVMAAGWEPQEAGEYVVEQLEGLPFVKATVWDITPVSEVSNEPPASTTS